MPSSRIVGGPATVSLSVDLDAPVDYHHFYRLEGAPPSAPFLREALAYLLDLFAELGVRATFFSIARDIEAEPELAGWLRRLVAAGHEVANHSHRHPHAFRHLGRERKAEEIDRAHAVLEEATGEAVVGFRAPAYDLDAETLELLITRGYRYDSSLNPTPFLVPMKLIVQLKARRRRVGLGTWRHGWSDPRPRVVAGHAGGSLVELPISVVPGVRFPFYGTITQLIGERAFSLGLSLLRRGRLPINYHLHAAEVASLGAASPGLGVPGYGSALDARRRRVRATVSELARGSRTLTLATLAQEVRAQELQRREAWAPGARPPRAHAPEVGVDR